MILSGKKLAKSICKSIKKEVSKCNNPPGLGIILVGDNPASKIYVNMKKKACQKVGFQYVQVDLPENSSNEDVIRNIHHLNYSKNIQGVLVQLPLPKSINEEKVLLAIDPKKDVDGFHPTNFGRMALEMESFIPATPYGIIELLERYNIEFISFSVSLSLFSFKDIAREFKLKL